MSKGAERTCAVWTRLVSELSELSWAMIPTEELAKRALLGLVKSLPLDWAVYCRHERDGQTVPFIANTPGCPAALIEEYRRNKDPLASGELPCIPEQGEFEIRERDGVSFCCGRLLSPGSQASHTLVLAARTAAALCEGEGARREGFLCFLRALGRFCENHRLRDARQQMERSLLSARGVVNHVAEVVCRSWRRLLHAPAVRLWIYNHALQEFDLLHECADAELTTIFHDAHNRLGMHSLAGKAITGEHVVESTDPANDPDGDGFRRQEQVLRRWPHILCVPLLLFESGEDNRPTNRRFGVMDIHVADLHAIRQPKDRLIFLGSLSAEALKRSQVQELIDAVQDMNRIAIRVVSAREEDRNPCEDPKKVYLDEILRLVRRYLHVGCVSVFEEMEMGSAIQCIASTGMQDEPDLGKVQYRAGEGVTWKCFRTNESLLLPDVRTDPDYCGSHQETRQVRPTDDHDPYLAAPLPGSREHAIGVIRVVERICSVRPDRLQNFTTHDRDLLELIAYHASSVLQILRVRERQRHFVGNTVHQVVQPLAGIMGYADNILDGSYGSLNNPRAETKLHFIRVMARNAHRMMRNCQLIVKNDPQNLRNAVAARPRHTERLTRYLMDRIIDVQSIRERDGVRVQLLHEHTVDALGEFAVDDVYFEQVLMNVLYNAVKFSYPHTTCEVSADREGATLLVTVASTGVPIDREEREMIFNDQIRGRFAEQYDPNGTGQGLYISKRIMQAFGGSLRLLMTKTAHDVVPPPGWPPAQTSFFQIVYPGAF